MTSKTEKEELDYPAYIAIDSEGLGEHADLYPSVSWAFAVLSHHGKVLHTWQTFIPVRVDQTNIEPRCWKEFWSHVPEQVTHLAAQCRKSPYTTVTEAYQAISDQIEFIYDTFDSVQEQKNGFNYPIKKGRLIWVTDNGQYDIGRLNHYLWKYTKRTTGVVYSEKGAYHCNEDCGSYKDGLKVDDPNRYQDLKSQVDQRGFKKTHDCIDDALHIGYEYAIFLGGASSL